MSVPAGFAWMHIRSVYNQQMGEYPPVWLNQLPTLRRVRFVKFCLQVRWRLTQEFLIGCEPE
jgi:hypothetical protein